MGQPTESKKLGRPVTKGGKDPARSIRVPDEEWQAWQATAERRGMSLAAWLRALANRAVRRG